MPVSKPSSSCQSSPATISNLQYAVSLPGIYRIERRRRGGVGARLRSAARAAARGRAVGDAVALSCACDLGSDRTMASLMNLSRFQLTSAESICPVTMTVKKLRAPGSIPMLALHGHVCAVQHVLKVVNE